MLCHSTDGLLMHKRHEFDTKIKMYSNKSMINNMIKEVF